MRINDVRAVAVLGGALAAFLVVLRVRCLALLLAFLDDLLALFVAVGFSAALRGRVAGGPVQGAESCEPGDTGSSVGGRSATVGRGPIVGRGSIVSRGPEPELWLGDSLVTSRPNKGRRV